MPQLFFKKPLQNAIRAGHKRTTLRRWSRPLLKAGQKAWSPGLGFLHIEAVEQVDLNSLTDSDAQADGFDTMSSLRQVLLELYPNQATDGKAWFRVFFRLPPVTAEPTAKSHKPNPER